MARMVKHTITGELIDLKGCYRVKIGSTNRFFNNEAEANEYIAERDQKAELTKAFRRLWFSMMKGFKKEDYYGNMELAFKIIYDKYPYKFLLPRLNSAMEGLDWVREKDFATGKAKLLYMLKVLTSDLENDIIEYKQTLTKTESTVKEVDDVVFNLSRQTVVKKDVNSIDEFL